MIVLITNDDGFDAPGIKILKQVIKEALKEKVEVWVIAPSHDRSGSGRSISLRKPIQTHQINALEFSIDGTPAECVFLALNKIMPIKPDLILSGINRGSNVGNDVMYSGTIAAAMEGAAVDIPSIALSQGYQDKHLPIDWSNSENFLIQVINQLMNNKSWKKSTVMNINFPSGNVRGIKFIEQGQYQMNNHLELIKNQDGSSSYTIHNIRPEQDNGDGSVKAIHDGYIAITPLQPDLTDYHFLNLMKQNNQIIQAIQ